jgi:hypothetical protein
MLGAMGISELGVDTDALSALIERVKASGGAETANTQKFMERLCDVLGLPSPEFSSQNNAQNDYAYERWVAFKHPDGSTSPGRIDLYKRGCFVLESKQSSIREARKHADQLSMLPEDATQVKSGTARRGTGGWDRAMLAARNQAESYARALPVEHGYPPFLIVLDVGHVMEVYADFSGQGKNYAHFPDRQTYRIGMDDLRCEDVQLRLRAIWTDPLSLDPAKKSAEVTRDIAGRLSIIAKRLEGKHDPKDVAEFLMRCLFTMFAEDVELIPKGKFTELLNELADNPPAFPMALEALWKAMDAGTYEARMMAVLRKFNGSLFKAPRALPLTADDIAELHTAAKQDWRDVEPAIFGTLLERALDPRERSKLGAHYTPRAYVERLVIPTIIEPLRADWDEVQAHVADLKREGRDAEALQVAKDFHHKLCTTRVLDPACGSGNFLYVSLELMKKLEGEVLVALEELGENQGRLAMAGETVGPQQFYGLEVNARAVPIADLVLWIGFLKWQLRTVGLSQISEPVLHAYGTIKHQDAILAWDRIELVRDEKGVPVTRWDGVGVKAHPVTGELVPDPEKQVEVYRYVNPRPAQWPEVEFIVGNPPFIGSKILRQELGDGYAEAVWSARPEVPRGADFVMHFWDQAAEIMRRDNSTLRRFGLITTNSATQTFSRRVLSRHLSGRAPLSIVYAIPDHPWMKASDKAAVRIAMTVTDRAGRKGILGSVVSERSLETDAPQVQLDLATGSIRPNLTIGADVAATDALQANRDVCSFGMALHGQGFVLDRDEVERLGGSTVAKPYAKGRDLLQRGPSQYVLDLSGLSRDQVERDFPREYQRVVERVKPERDPNRRAAIRDNWWLFGWDRPVLRSALAGVSRYLATTETSKHRVFQFLSKETIPDHMIVATALDTGRFLSVTSSRVHVTWALASGGTLEDRPRYSKTRTFDPFPFPAFSELEPELTFRLDGYGERLDAFRKARLVARDFLTITTLYNALERLRELDSGASVEPLSEEEKDINDVGLVSTLKLFHDDIDRAVFEAYGWADLIPALVGKPGATTPSPHKSAQQEAAEEELLTRLVALNKERAAEEARGLVRWLRPEYQIPRLGKKVSSDGEQIEVDVTVAAKVERPKWPGDAFEQIKMVRDVLAKAPAPMPVEGIATSFDGRLTDKRRSRVRQVLDTLVATGAARTDENGQGYFVPR